MATFKNHHLCSVNNICIFLLQSCYLTALFSNRMILLYQDGTCIVHHLFGHEVVERINEMYCDAFLTAHFEVPGEMFSLAMEAKRRGMGVVGSTQNILDFIKQRVQEALDRNVNDHLQFVLGTESGMVTSIVAAVRSLLGSAKSSNNGAKINVEIVFPVSTDSMTRTSNSSLGLNSIKVGDVILPIIPGVASGEGCSIHGGCASCPYMKVVSTPCTFILIFSKRMKIYQSRLCSYTCMAFSSFLWSYNSFIFIFSYFLLLSDR